MSMVGRSQTKFKLTYFNIRARGEPIRLIFAAAGVPFEDNRIDKSDWPKLKETFPYGKVPLLEVDGKPLAESGAICRYLARQFDLVGSSEFEAAKCEEYVDAMMDSRPQWKAYFFETDPSKKEVLKKEFMEKQIPTYFPKFEKIVEESDGNFLLGKNYTWADLHIAHTLAFYEETVDPEILAPYPNLKQLVKAVFEIPQIQAWVEKRPKTPM